jgi:hypothetical protein
MYDSFSSEARALRREIAACHAEVLQINEVAQVVRERGGGWAHSEVLALLRSCSSTSVVIVLTP